MEKSNKNTGHKLVEISTQVTPGLLNYVQSEVPSWVTASGNLIFQVDKSVLFFFFMQKNHVFDSNSYQKLSPEGSQRN